MKKIIAPEPPTNRIYDGRTFLDIDGNEHVIEMDEEDLWVKINLQQRRNKNKL